MAEYYIRTQDRDESRGPFTPIQLVSLAEAEQVTIDTLYYDDAKEEWLPIGMNAELREEVFPEREKLKLKVDNSENPEDSKKKKKKKSAADEKKRNTVSEMLAAAENKTKNARSRQRQEDNLKRAAYLSDNGLCLVMLLSSVSLIAPYLLKIKEIALSQKLLLLLNYPLILLGIFDLLLSFYLYFGDRKLHPLLRGRAMITLGLGAYVGWALGDMYVLAASVSFGIGILWTTLTRSFYLSIPAVLLSFGGSALLAYLSLIGYFSGLIDSVYFEFFSN